MQPPAWRIPTVFVDLTEPRGYATRDDALGALDALDLDPRSHRAFVAVTEAGRFVPVVVTNDVFATTRCARSLGTGSTVCRGVSEGHARRCRSGPRCGEAHAGGCGCRRCYWRCAGEPRDRSYAAITRAIRLRGGQQSRPRSSRCGDNDAKRSMMLSESIIHTRYRTAPLLRIGPV
jgi:hypothetical protein